MKQKKLGKQFHVWNKSLDLRQSYIREQKGKLNKTQLFLLSEECDWDFYYGDYYDDSCSCYYGDVTCYVCGYIADTDVHIYKVLKLLENGSNWQQLQNHIPSTALQSSNQQSLKKDLIHLSKENYFEPIQIANKLLEHTKELNNNSLDKPLPATISNAIANKEDLEVLQNIAKELALTIFTSEFILYSILFSPFWIRAPKSFRYQNLNEQNVEISLIEYLFVKYPVPQFLYKAFSNVVGENIKWVCWFIIFAQGGSLSKIAPVFDWTIAKKFPHYLQNVPPNFTLKQGSMYAEILRLGGSRKEFDRLCLASSSIFVIDPTSSRHSISNNFLPFWQGVVKWLTKNREQITDENSSQILDWALHMHIEGNRFGQTFSLEGRSVTRVLEATTQYLCVINQSYDFHNISWKKHGVDWEWADKLSQTTWSFVELASGLELIEEGRAMRHCVSTYAKYCVAGYIAIVSLKHNDVRQVTIELRLANKKVVQAKGYANRQTTSQEEAIINKWLAQTVIVTDTLI